MKQIYIKILPLIEKLQYAIIALLFLWMPFPVEAQTGYGRNQFMFDHLGMTEGLGSQRVYSVMEGPDGAIWIGTKNGIDRYNGQTVRNYMLNTKRKYSDASGRSIHLFSDVRRHIHCFDNKGNLFTYNPATDQFEFWFDLSVKMGGSVILSHVYMDASHRAWLATNTGLFLLDCYHQIHSVVRGCYVNHVSPLGTEMIGCSDHGVFAVNRKTSRTRWLFRKVNALTSYYDASTHILWVGTFHDGILALDMRTNGVRSLPALSVIPHTPVRAIMQMNRHSVLFGVDGSGVYAADRTGKDVHLLFSADDETGNALHGNGIYDICRDHFGNIWVCSYSGGVDVAYPMGNLIQVYQHEYLNKQSLISNSVNAVLQTADGVLYFGTDHGVSIYDTHRHLWHHCLSNKVAITLCQSPDGGVLVGTYGDGVFAVNAQGGSRPMYNVENGKLQTDYVYSLWVDRRHSLWIGCLDGDLVQMSGNVRKTYPVQQVQCITDMPDGRLAVGTTDGFFAVDAVTGKVQHYFRGGGFPGRDVNAFVQSILFTDRTTAWLATDGGGIYIYNLRNNRLQTLNVSSGLPSNTVYSLQKDSRGRIFTSTDMGLAMVLPGKRPEVVNINFVRGMDREYKRTSIARLNDGRLIFGSSSGAVVLDPEQINRLYYPSKLAVTRLEIFGQQLDVDARTELYAMLRQGEVVLSYYENTFAVYFESINYKYQHDILYQYKLDGFDGDWGAASSAQSARYTNLPPGHYVLHVRSISRNDGRIMDSRDVDITVSQPWWNTFWAWMVYLCILGWLTYILWRSYKNHLERKYFDEKINFFVHTAHDIRTPLSLILAPLSNMDKDQSIAPATRNYLNIARRNGDKLLNMITQLLDFQKADRNETSMNVSELDLKQLLQQQVEKFRLMAQQKHMQLTIASCPDQLSVWMDANMADKIFENLLSNSIKYTHESGTVTVKAWVEKDEIHITVADNGIGIPKNAQRHIFQNFYRADNAVNSKEVGSGLGLMLIQRLVRLHHGKLTFDSEEGRGTTFMITLKQGHDHLPATIHQQAMPGIPQKAEQPFVPSDRPQDNLHTVAEVPQQQLFRGSQNTLLFVDDNDELRNYISLTYAQDYQVVTKASAEEALEYLRDGYCDIVVSDVMMPGMDGDELCRRIKENYDTSWLPVILLTAKTGRDYVIEGLNKGADDYISKPFDEAILKSKIDSMLANRRRLSTYYMNRTVEIARGETPQPEPAEVEVALEEDDKVFIDKATRLVKDNLMNQEFNIDYLCREMAMSRTLFYGKLKTLTSQTPQDFVRIIRLEKAAALLKEGKGIVDVSVMTGFVNTKYFSTVFKKYFGVSPSKYQ